MRTKSKFQPMPENATQEGIPSKPGNIPAETAKYTPKEQGEFVMPNPQRPYRPEIGPTQTPASKKPKVN